VSEPGEVRKRAEASRREAAQRRANERDTQIAAGVEDAWSAQGGLPPVGLLYVPVAGLALLTGVIGAFLGSLAIGVLAAAAAGALGVFAVRASRARLPSAGSLNPRLKAAYDRAAEALDEADELDAARKAELTAQLQTAMNAIVTSNTSPPVLAKRIAEFEEQAARLTKTAQSLGSAGGASGALDDALGAFEAEAQARAEVDEALAAPGAESRKALLE
jgi:hypothetical protein